MAGRLEQTSNCKTSHNVYKLQISVSTLSHQENWQQLFLRQDSHFSAKCLHVHFATKFWFYKKKTNHTLCQSRWLKIGSKFDTIRPSEIALNGKHTHKMCKNTREHTQKMHYAHIYPQSNSWWRMLWIGHDLLHESICIPKISWNHRARVMSKVQCCFGSRCN